MAEIVKEKIKNIVMLRKSERFISRIFYSILNIIIAEEKINSNINCDS